MYIVEEVDEFPEEIASEFSAMEDEGGYSFAPHKAAEPYLEDVRAAEQKYGLPRNLLARLIDQESKFNPKAVSKKGAQGIAQIMPEYHPGADPSDPKASIDYAAKYLKENIDRFGSVEKALAAYNAGPTRVSKSGMGNLPDETRGYVRKVHDEGRKGGGYVVEEIDEFPEGLFEEKEKTEVAQPLETSAKREYSAEGFAGQAVEGTKDVARNALTGLAAHAQGTDRVAKQGGKRIRSFADSMGMPRNPDPKPAFGGQEAAGKKLKEWSLNEKLKADPEYLNSAGFWEDVVRMGPQVVSQMATHLATGGAGSMAFMGAQILGATYEEQVKKGVDPERATAAGLANAVMQAPMEALGISKLGKFWKTKGRLVSKLKELGAAMGSEWLTETLQSQPELITGIWAQNPDASKLETLEKYLDEAPKALGEGAYEGLVTVPFTVVGGVPGVIGAAKRDYKIGKLSDEDKKVVAEIEENPTISQKEVDDYVDSLLKAAHDGKAGSGDESKESRSSASDFSALDDTESEKQTEIQTADSRGLNAGMTGAQATQAQELNRIRQKEAAAHKQAQREAYNKEQEALLFNQKQQQIQAQEKAKKEQEFKVRHAEKNRQDFVAHITTPENLIATTSQVLKPYETFGTDEQKNIVKPIRALQKALATGNATKEQLKDLLFDLKDLSDSGFLQLAGAPANPEQAALQANQAQTGAQPDIIDPAKQNANYKIRAIANGLYELGFDQVQQLEALEQQEAALKEAQKKAGMDRPKTVGQDKSHDVAREMGSNVRTKQTLAEQASQRKSQYETAEAVRTAPERISKQTRETVSPDSVVYKTDVDALQRNAQVNQRQTETAAIAKTETMRRKAGQEAALQNFARVNLEHLNDEDKKELKRAGVNLETKQWPFDPKEYGEFKDIDIADPVKMNRIRDILHQRIESNPRFTKAKKEAEHKRVDLVVTSFNKAGRLQSKVRYRTPGQSLLNMARNKKIPVKEALDEKKDLEQQVIENIQTGKFNKGDGVRFTNIAEVVNIVRTGKLQSRGYDEIHATEVFGPDDTVFPKYGSNMHHSVALHIPSGKIARKGWQAKAVEIDNDTDAEGISILLPGESKPLTLGEFKQRIIKDHAAGRYRTGSESDKQTLDRMWHDAAKGILQPNIDQLKLRGYNVHVAESFDQLPDHIKAEGQKEALGVFDASTGKDIYIVSDAHTGNPIELKRTLWHEIGHHAVRKVMGKEFDTLIRKADVYYKTAGDLIAAEEALIDDFVANKRTGLVHRLRDLLIRLARKLGFSKNEITDSEIAAVVRKMRENALEGKHEVKDIDIANNLRYNSSESNRINNNARRTIHDDTAGPRKPRWATRSGRTGSDSRQQPLVRGNGGRDSQGDAPPFQRAGRGAIEHRDVDLPPNSHPIAQYTPTETFKDFAKTHLTVKKGDTVFEPESRPIFELDSTKDYKVFHQAMTEATQALGVYGQMVEVKDAVKYKHMRLFLVQGGKAGFALDGKDIVSVFRHPGGPKGTVTSLLPLGIMEGGRTLDCFDGALPSMYSRYGFEAASRLKWVDEYAPDPWDYDTHGRPDVVLMAYTLGDPRYAWKTVRTADSVKHYKPGDGEYFDSWDDAAQARDKAVEENEKYKGAVRYRKKPPDPPYAQYIGPKAVGNRPSYLTGLEKIIAGGMDKLYALKKLEQGQDVGAMSGYKSMNLLSNFPSIFSSFLKHGTVKYQDHWIGMDVDATGLEGIVRELGENSDRFFEWMTMHSAKEMIQKGRSDLFGAKITDADMLQQMHDHLDPIYRQNKQTWDKARARLGEINTSVLDFCEQAGMIDKDKRKEWERADYIPFYRVIEDAFSGTGDLDQLLPKAAMPSQLIHKLEGSTKGMGDPIANLLSAYQFMLHESLLNLGRKKSLVLALNANLVTKLPKKPDDMWKAVAIRHNGKAQYYNVHYKDLYDALVDLDAQSGGKASAWLKVLTKPKKWLTAAVTAAPGFRAANFVRDTLATAAVGKGFIPVYDSIKGGIHALFKSKEFKEFAATGGAFHGAYHQRDIQARDFESVEKLKKKLTGDRSIFLKAWDFWNEIGEASENAARMGLYLRNKAKGMSNFEAGYQAKDLLDFHRVGSDPILNFFIKSVPFMNARIQGLYKMGRAVKSENTAQFALMAGLTLLGSVALHLRNEDEDWYKELPDYERRMYWHFSKTLRIPVPFELGSIFGTLPMAVTETARGDRKGKELAGFALEVVKDIFAFDPTPQTVKPIYEDLANRDAFTGQEIVPSHRENLEPSLQYDHRTSKTFRLLGEQLNISPQRAEHLARGYFGFMVDLTTAVTDLAVMHTTDMAEDPAGALTDRYMRIMGISRFSEREGKPRTYTRSQERFYEMMHGYDRALKSYKEYRKIKEKAKARAYKQEHRTEIKLGRRLSKFQRRISDINTKIRLIRESGKYTPEEKAAKIERELERREREFNRAIKVARRKDGGL